MKTKMKTVENYKVVKLTCVSDSDSIYDAVISSNFAEQIFRIHMEEILEHHEEFWLICLSRSNKVSNISMIGSGGVDACIADPKLIFQTALLSNASSLIMCHNHPSGKTTPSDNDKKLTQKIVEAGKVLDVAVLDHLILTKDSKFSFADNGLIN